MSGLGRCALALIVGSAAACSLIGPLPEIDGDGPGPSSNPSPSAPDGRVVEPEAGADALTDTSVAPPELALVQSNAVAQPGALTTSIPIAPTKAGSLVVVVVAEESDNTTVVSSITDNTPSGGNTYVSTMQRSVDKSCNDSLEIWYAANVRPGATAISVTMTTSVKLESWVAEFSGIRATQPFLGGATTSDQPRSTIITAPSVTVAVTPALVISSEMTCGVASGLRGPTPFRALPFLNGQNTAYTFAATAGTYGAAWNSDNSTWNATTVAFH